MKTIFPLKAIAFSFITLCCISSIHGADNNVIIYAGSSTVGEFIKGAQKIYKKSQIKMRTTKIESLGGLKAINSCFGDILVGVAKKVNKSDISNHLESVQLGKDLLCAIVNKDNSVKKVTMQQLKKIFIGEITNWKELGGSDESINVYIAGPESATRSVFKAKVLGKNRYFGKRLQTIRPDSKIRKKVADDPNGIGQLSRLLFRGSKEVKPLVIDNQIATSDNNNYPISRTVCIVMEKDPTKNIKDFIRWIKSKEGQKILSEYFIPITNTTDGN